MKKVKVGSMKLVVNTNIGTIRRLSDDKYMGRLYRSSKGNYFNYHGKRVYIPGGIMPGTRKSRKARKSRRKARKSRKSRRKARKSRRKSRKSRRKSRKSRRKSRKSRRKSRKSRRKSRKSRRKSRKSRKSRRKKTKAQLQSKRSTKKYATRDSPPYGANQHCGKKMRGNDGNWWRSVANKSGICTWRRV